MKAIGAIDGCHISIRPPSTCPENYINRKQFHSVILQAVCDNDMLITDVYGGWPGSVHDARVFRRSPLHDRLEANLNEMCPNGSYLIGDAAYSLQTYMMTPFKDCNNLTQQQKTYNFKHSSTRMRIEHTFGLLKGRWRRLKHLDIVDLQTILNVIMTTCILHNLCLLHSDDLEDFMSQSLDVNAFNGLPLYHNAITGVSKRTEVVSEM